MTVGMDKEQLEQERASLKLKRADMQRRLDAQDEEIKAAAQKQLDADTEKESGELDRLLKRFGFEEPDIKFEITDAGWLIKVHTEVGFSSHVRANFELKSNEQVCALVREREALQKQKQQLDRETLDIQKALQQLAREQG